MATFLNLPLHNPPTTMARYANDFPALTPWLMRPIERCSDLSPNVSLMSCVTFSG